MNTVDEFAYDWRELPCHHARVRDVILPGLIALAVGAVIGTYNHIHQTLLLDISVILLVFLFLAIRGGYKLSTVTVVALLCLSAGVFRGGAVSAESQPHMSLIGVQNNYEGVVVDDATESSSRVRLGDGSNALVRFPEYSHLVYGDVVKFNGVLKEPEDFRTDSGVEFRYRDFLRARGVHYVVNAREIRVLRRGEGNFLVDQIYHAKSWVTSRYRELVSPHADLYLGMLLGSKSGLPKDIKKDFIASGLIHIVVLSGANLTLVAGAVFILARRVFGFRPGVIASAMFATLYAVMGGAEGATLRALVMVLAVLLGVYMQRESSMLRLLTFSASVLIAVNPYIALDDPSFQLSVLALLGLVLITPIVEQKIILKYERLPVVLATYIAAIAGAQALVMPFVAYMSGSFAPYAIIANVLVLFMLAPIVPLGLILFLPFIKGSIYIVLSFPLVLLLGYVIQIAHITAGLPFAQVQIHLGLIPMLVVYVVIAYVLWRIWRKPNMTPLARFVVLDEAKVLRKGGVPWVE